MLKWPERFLRHVVSISRPSTARLLRLRASQTSSVCRSQVRWAHNIGIWTQAAAHKKLYFDSLERTLCRHSPSRSGRLQAIRAKCC